MKKTIRYLSLAIFSFSFFSCAWEKPETISIKTNATYNFGIGSIKQDFSDLVSTDAILDASFSAGGNSKIYDYYPDKLNGHVQRYLMKLPIQDIPINFTDYFKETNLAESISDLSFSQTITIPELKLTVDQEIPTDALKALLNNTITAKGTTSAVIFSTEFGFAEYSSGTLFVSITNKSLTGVVELYGTDDAFICSSSLNMGTAELPLDNVVLSKTGMSLVIPAGFGTFTATVTPDSQLKKITEYTSASPITVPVSIPISNGNKSEDFSECTIGTGSMDTEIVIPSSWSNVNTAYDVTLSGGIACGANKQTGTKNTVTLDNVSVSQDATNFSSNLELSFESSTIDLSKSIRVKASTNITSYASLGITLSEITPTLNQKQAISSEMKTIIERIILTKCGLKGTYKNTFPEGNDITLTADSAFLGLAGGSQILKANTTTEESILIVSDNDSTIKFRDKSQASDEFDEMDFAVNIHLPGAPASNPNKIVIASVVPNDSYEISINLEPEINWKEIVLYSAGVEQADCRSTGLNISQMLTTFTQSIGGDFGGKLSIKSLPIYLYAVKPQMECFNNAKFTGSLELLFGSQSTGTFVEKTEYGTIDFMQNGEMPFADMPQLQLEDKTVVSSMDTFTPSGKANIATITNNALNDADGSIYIKYKLKFSNSGNNGNTFSITWDDYTASGSTTSSIAIMAFIEIPLEFALSDDVHFDLFSMAGKTDGTDLLNREGPSGDSDKINFLEAVRSIKIKYNATTLPFYGIPSVSLFLDLDGKENSLFEEQNLSLEGGTLELYDYNELMSIYPLVPVADIILHKGSFSIPRKVGLEANISLAIEMDPNYEFKIYGGAE